MEENADKLEKVRKVNVRNLLSRVRDGKPLSRDQLEIVRQELDAKSPQPEPMPNHLTADEFANLVNLDKRRVQQLAKEGVIEKEGRGRYPLKQITAYIRYLQELVQRRKIEPEESGPLNPEQEKARADKERADKLALENKKRRGELVEASEVDAAWADIALAMRSKLLGLGTKLAPVLAGEEDAVKIHEEIDAAMRQVLEELSRNGDDEPADSELAEAVLEEA